MKVISFSATEILPALLDKSKTQTIGPLFDKTPIDAIEKAVERMFKTGYPERRPRFKVGEKIQLMWKCRSKAQWFCNACGKEIKQPQSGHPETCLHEKVIPFPKFLGEVEITEVFEIEMRSVKARDDPNIGEGEDYVCRIRILKNGKWEEMFEDNEIELGELDGFEDGGQFHDYFDKHYNLEYSPKRFVVYRWKWL